MRLSSRKSSELYLKNSAQKKRISPYIQIHSKEYPRQLTPPFTIPISLLWMAYFLVMNKLTFRVRTFKMFHCGLFFKRNEMSILFSLSIRVQILRIGPMVLHLLLHIRNTCSMLRVMWSFHMSLISKRISLISDSEYSFVNLGLNSRPTFFGCNATNFTDYSRTPPLVMYFPHTGWTGYTNFSTFTLEYSPDQVAEYIQNGVATAVCLYYLTLTV